MAPSSTAPRRRGLLFWALSTLVVFYAIYPASNWLAARQSRRYDFLTPWDAHIPLVPEFIWVYFSFFIFILLPIWWVDSDDIDALGRRQVLATVLCGVVFALFPANLAFERVLPEAEPYRSIFGWMFAVDAPHNLLPSLHIVYTVATGVALWAAQWRRGRPGRCALIALWGVAICASTMLVHQHHVLDVVAAVVLVAVLQRLVRTRPEGF
ncbi:MAG: phosphatase PAP2 family protein [Comamonas sp.]